MKQIKTYITLSILNALCMVLVVGGGSIAQKRASDPSITPMVMPDTPTAKPIIIRVVHKTRPVDTSNPSQSPQVNAAPTTQQVPQPTQDLRCLIQIDGSTYDVSVFRSMHSGGNVFTCGADMSAVFWSKHSQRTLDQMAKYRI